MQDMQEVDRHSWVVGFIEASSSFHININKLMGSQHRPLVLIRPVICLVNRDRKPIQAILDHFGCEVGINVLNRNSPKTDKYNASIKDVAEVNKIRKILVPEQFISDLKRDIYIRFLKAAVWCDDNGTEFRKWIPEIKGILQLKNELNSHRSGRRAYTDWEQKIKSHLK